MTMNSKLIAGVIAVAALGTAALAGCDPNAAATLVGQAAHETSTQGANAASFVQPKNYTFKTVDDPGDRTFNQLLGINDRGIIAAYFGSGAAGHPNKGFRVAEQAITGFANENFPRAVQTQVIGINESDVTVGFYSTMNNANNTNENTGFYRLDDNVYHSVTFPTSDNANPKVNQLLGVNDSDNAVGFYTDAKGNNHGYEYSIRTRKFRAVTVSGEGATSVTVTGIDDSGDVVGFFTGTGGEQDAFVLTDRGKQTVLAYPGAAITQAFGLNNRGEVVGTYTVGTGNNAQTHGFTWTAAGKFQTVDDPNGVGATTLNGVNDEGQLVGFYTDSAGNTDGLLATPSNSRPTPKPSGSMTATASPSMSASASASPSGTGSGMGMGTGSGTGSMPGGGSSGNGQLTLQQMPQGTVTLSQSSGGMLEAQVTVSGLTPGSQHVVEIDLPNSEVPAVKFQQQLSANSAGDATATLQSDGPVDSLPNGAYFTIRLGVSTSDFNRNPVAAEPIAETNPLPSNLNGDQQLQLMGVDVSPVGESQGKLSGTATVTYNSAAQTLSIELNATGLAPGAHTAQIDSGSCQSQGATLYTPMDFQADSNGNIVAQTRTVSGVTSMPASTGWYLDLHQGGSGTLQQNGSPALNFRPVLCANG